MKWVVRGARCGGAGRVTLKATPRRRAPPPRHARPLRSAGQEATAVLPALMARTPRACMRCRTGEAGDFSSTATIRPRPRTSRIAGCLIARSAAMKRSPIAVTCALNSGVPATSRVAMPAAQISGLPPKVVPCDPEPTASATRPETTVSPIGRPLASGFESVMISGCTPLCSQHQVRPVRNAVCTSSKISSAPAFAEASQPLQILGRCDTNSALALDWLQDDRCRACDCLAHLRRDRRSRRGCSPP